VRNGRNGRERKRMEENGRRMTKEMEKWNGA
jgi:hypothetical protein